MAIVATACAPTSERPTSSAASPSPTLSTPAASSAVVVRGGCGATQVVKGDVPGWLDDAGAHSNPDSLPYAVATPATAAGFLFGYPLRAGHPENPANKILWVVALARGGSPLVISGHPVGKSAPLVAVTQPANSTPGEIYPTIVDVPEPGCWHLDLVWAGHQTSIELEYQ
jgi:hypothetical protein